SYCQFDYDPNLAGNQFRLLYLQNTGSGYQLNGTNPGQFYDNVFYAGTAGDTVTLTIQVPYPFVTNGAVPIHGYSTYAVAYQPNGQLCFTPGTDVTSSYTITTSGGHLSTSGAPVILLGDYSTQNTGASTTVTVTGVVPSTGHLYVTIHLEYG